jgi:superfamily I DNA/RNA helicase
VVGDDDQSIYGWRGAEISNLLDMEKYFPEVKVVKLEQNYRSTNTILKAANAVIGHNVRRRGKKLWSQKEGGAKITIHTFSSDEEEARTIVEEIEYARITKRIPWLAQAILFRTNLQARPLETELRKGGVRYHLIGGQSFFDRREIRDFLAYLKVFVNPDDDISLLRIANTPARGLSDATMAKLLGASHERKCPVFEVMKNPAVTATLAGKTRQSVESFVEFVERTRAPLLQAASLSLQEWADRFLSEIGYYQELTRSEKTPEGGESRIRNIQDLVQTLDSTSARPADTNHETQSLLPGQPAFDRLQTFLEEITLDSEREEEEENTGDAVTLITMHSCKGLEFPHVYVVGLEQGLLPHSRSTAENTLDEERRLFYVAITRAMQTLTLSHCAMRKKFGQGVPCHPSQFLNELPEELVEHADEKAREPVSTDSGRDIFAAMRASIE